MKLKYIVALAVFFGNVFITLLEQHTRHMAGRLLLTGRQRMMMKVNEIVMYAVIFLLVIFVVVNTVHV